MTKKKEKRSTVRKGILGELSGYGVRNHLEYHHVHTAHGDSIDYGYMVRPCFRKQKIEALGGVNF